jgi:N6-adenosine-specific RNA methylase IME4
MSKKFQVIVADPPWSFGDRLKMSDVARGAAANYNTMTISNIKDLPIKEVTSPDGAVLALWVPSSLLQEGLDVMNAWGFTHKQTYVWVKTKKEPLKDVVSSSFSLVKAGLEAVKSKANLRKATLDVLNKLKMHDMLAFGMGRLFRQTHEICLVGTSNNKIYKSLANKSQRSVSFAENLKHSAKPEHLQDSLEIMFPNTDKLELFARRSRSGWTCLGNEVCNGEDITVSLSKL